MDLKQTFAEYLEAEKRLKELHQSLGSALWEKHKDSNYKLPEEFPLVVGENVFTVEWDSKQRQFLNYTNQGNYF